MGQLDKPSVMWWSDITQLWYAGMPWFVFQLSVRVRLPTQKPNNDDLIIWITLTLISFTYLIAVCVSLTIVLHVFNSIQVIHTRGFSENIFLEISLKIFFLLYVFWVLILMTTCNRCLKELICTHLVFLFPVVLCTWWNI